ncbi:MAG: hypothetical protein ACI835_005755 [Planctomycetota bacterium]|jgi:hypothetical protein
MSEQSQPAEDRSLFEGLPTSFMMAPIGRARAYRARPNPWDYRYSPLELAKTWSSLRATICRDDERLLISVVIVEITKAVQLLDALRAVHILDIDHVLTPTRW